MSNTTKLDKRYNFKESESDILKRYYPNDGLEEGAISSVYNWDDTDLDNNSKFSIDTPPPTVSGILHIGHVYSYCQADFIARHRRMSGKNVFYPIGFDDNGLPTERLVEKKRKKKAHTYDKADFVRACKDVSEESRAQFRALFQRMALSFDRNQEYNTANDKCQKLSQKSFIDLYNKNMLYRKLEPMLWDPEDRTAIAQAEVEEIEKESQMNYLNFTLNDGGSEKVYTVATTRPEMLAACVAVFYHPEDERYKELEGKYLCTPLFNAKIPVFADEDVKQDKGSGLVMCCTFGDEQDIIWWRRHRLFTMNLLVMQDQKNASFKNVIANANDWIEKYKNEDTSSQKKFNFLQKKLLYPDFYPLQFFWEGLLGNNTLVDGYDGILLLVGELFKTFNCLKIRNASIESELLRCLGLVFDHIPIEQCIGVVTSSVTRTSAEYLLSLPNNNYNKEGLGADEEEEACEKIRNEQKAIYDYEIKKFREKLEKKEIKFKDSFGRKKLPGQKNYEDYIAEGCYVFRINDSNISGKLKDEDSELFSKHDDLQKELRSCYECRGIEKVRASIITLLNKYDCYSKNYQNKLKEGMDPIVDGVDKITHMIKIAERSKAALEIMPTSQWFIKVLDCKDELLKKADEINWYPAHMKQRIVQWIEGLRWDWCISRQRYFGVPIPAYYFVPSQYGAEMETLFPEDDYLPTKRISDDDTIRFTDGTYFAPKRDYDIQIQYILEYDWQDEMNYLYSTNFPNVRVRSYGKQTVEYLRKRKTERDDENHEKIDNWTIEEQKKWWSNLTKIKQSFDNEISSRLDGFRDCLRQLAEKNGYNKARIDNEIEPYWVMEIRRLKNLAEEWDCADTANEIRKKYDDLLQFLKKDILLKYLSEDSLKKEYPESLHRSCERARNSKETRIEIEEAKKVRKDAGLKGAEKDFLNLIRGDFYGGIIDHELLKKAKIIDDKEKAGKPLSANEKYPILYGSYRGSVNHQDHELHQDLDVMDTWATSSITPQIAAGAITEKDAVQQNILGRYNALYPFDLRTQAHEIIRTWAFYTIVKSHLHSDEIPWKNVMVSGWCLAEDRSKMSKSVGNIIDPIKLLDQYGVDVVRYWAANSRCGADTIYSQKIMEEGKRLTAKLWNAAKFIEIMMGKIEINEFDCNKVTEGIDLWLLHSLRCCVEEINRSFESFDYCQARILIQNFFFSVFCDNYLEIVKVRAYAELKEVGKSQQESAIHTLGYVFDVIIHMFAPFLPYIVDEIYSKLYLQDIGKIHSRGSWPDVSFIPEIDECISDCGEIFIHILALVRAKKSENNLSMKDLISKVEISFISDSLADAFKKDMVFDLKNVIHVSEVEIIVVKDIPASPEPSTYHVNIEI